MHRWGIDDLDSNPRCNKMPSVLLMMSNEDKLSWMYEQADIILNIMRHNVPSVSNSIQSLRHSLNVIKCNEDIVESYLVDAMYKCSECKKEYKTRNGFKKHLQSNHESVLLSAVERNLKKIKYSGHRHDFIDLMLLQRDLWDAYRYCDGDRVFINIKLAFLHFFTTGHYKYRQWLFRMLAYDIALLSPQKAFEYRWNISVNLSGGVGNNIPDDNLVELYVRKLKDLLHAQGSNLTFESAKVAFASMDYCCEIKDKLRSCTQVHKRYSSRTAVEKDSDIVEMAKELNSAIIDQSDKQSECDYVQSIEPQELFDWFTEQSKILAAVSQ